MTSTSLSSSVEAKFCDIAVSPLGKKLADTTHSVRDMSGALNGQEAYEHRCGPRRVSENGSEHILGNSVTEDVETSVSSGGRECAQCV